MERKDAYMKGRGAQINTHNRFLKRVYIAEHEEVLDEPMLKEEQTQVFFETSRKIINKVKSPDIPLMYSMNPYQGCEHGCLYCYARVTHEYWGLSAGLDFERKIIVKKNAPELLERHFMDPKWEVHPIMFSGNTDCYQPLERKLKLTRRMLEVLLKFRHPVSIITKNALILRDIDLLKELNELNLLHVSISITSLDESLRQKLEPRTATARKKLEVIQILSELGIPINVMVAPIIPGLTSHEIPEIIRLAAEAGASAANFTIVRLNGAIASIFQDWLEKNYPDRAQKVLNQIKAYHGGELSDSRYGTRMRGEGNIAASIRQLFQVAKTRYMTDRKMKPYDLSAFIRNDGGQLALF